MVLCRLLYKCDHAWAYGENPLPTDENLKIFLTIGQKQKNHARNCKTTLQEFSVLTKEEATQLKRAANSGAVRTTVDNASSLIETNAASTPSKVVRGQKKKRARGTGAYPPEPSNDLSSFEGEEKNGKRKKRKLSTETTIPPSRTRPRNRNIVG